MIRSAPSAASHSARSALRIAEENGFIDHAQGQGAIQRGPVRVRADHYAATAGARLAVRPAHTPGDRNCRSTDTAQQQPVEIEWHS